MNSSFLCVIVIGLQVIQVFAEDLLHSQLRRENLQKMNKDNEENTDGFHSQLRNQILQKMDEDNEENTDQFHAQLRQENLQEMNEDNEENTDRLHSQLKHEHLKNVNEDIQENTDRLHSQLRHEQLKNMNEDIEENTDRFHSQLRNRILQKMNEDNEENTDRFHSQRHEDLKKINEDIEENTDLFHSPLWHKNLQKINEERKRRKVVELEDYMAKKKTDELADFLASNLLEDGGQPQHMSPEKTKALLQCADKTGVSPDTIVSIKGGDWQDGDQNARAWVQCVLMENKLMTDQSVFRLDVAFKCFSSVEKKLLEANIDKCLPAKAMPPVEISWAFAKCFQAADPVNSLF